MNVDWMQVAMVVVRRSARDLAVLLDISEAEAGWGLIKLFEYALERVPQGEYPSRHDLVPGPMAARLIARAAGYMGDPDRYVQACEELAHPILQKLPDGVRFRGMDRYDVILDGEETRSAKAKKAADARWAAAKGHAQSIGQALPEQCSSNAPGCQDKDVDRDSEEKPPLPPPREPPKLVVVGKKKTLRADELTPAQRSRWDQLQRGRDNAGLLKESAPPADFAHWSDELDAQGVDPPRLEHALALYLRDPDFKPKLWPTAVFITPGVFGKRLPQPAEEAIF